jgi:hypothetical protein
MTLGAITAGAVNAADTPGFGVNHPANETFSSSGAGTELLFSNNGTPLAAPDPLSPVAASGVDNIHTSVSDLTDFFGTSAASASLAGVAALLLAEDPNLTPAQVDKSCRRRHCRQAIPRWAEPAWSSRPRRGSCGPTCGPERAGRTECGDRADREPRSRHGDRRDREQCSRDRDLGDRKPRFGYGVPTLLDELNRLPTARVDSVPHHFKQEFGMARAAPFAQRGLGLRSDRGSRRPCPLRSKNR